MFDEIIEGQNKLNETLEEIHETLLFSNRILMMVNAVNIATIITIFVLVF